MDFSSMNEIEGLQFIPVDDKKRPIVKNWQTVKAKHNISNCYGVGLVCGEPSGGVEALDFDLKYDISGDLFTRYKNLVQNYDNGLLKKLVVQKTKNGGYHLIFRCSKNEGNLKLANRPTTEEERGKTYSETYTAECAKGKTHDEATNVAKRSSENDKVRVLIETRGIGGQIVISPTEGYEMIFGDLMSISEITPEERDSLFGIARMFNEVLEEVAIERKGYQKKTEGLSPFDDYNERGDVVGLLQNYGWKIVSQKGQKVHFLRPGQTTALTSGNYDYTRRWFTVFTTSTEFNPQTAYLPYAVFAKLECKDNFSEAAKRLLDMGYGERKEEKKPAEKPQSTRKISSRVDLEDNDFSFLATGADYDPYLKQVRDGTLPQGLTTGCPSLDEHFLFKRASFVMNNGVDNVGKTKFIWWLLLIAAMYHGWKGVIFASENTLGSCMRALMQFYWGKPLHGKYAMNDKEYDIAYNFVQEHFKLIKAQEDLYNYKDIINMTKKARIKYPDLTYTMIDPYNSLKIDLSGFSKLNTHEYHYEALSEMKAYGQQTDYGWYINHHAVTAAARAKDGEKKYPLAPNKADTEGGQKVANKADDFLTIHRITQHPTEWMVTEVHVRKIKETETGGRPTSIDHPVKFERYKGECAFIEKLEEGTGRNPIDPIERWHSMKEEQQQQPLFTHEQPPIKNWDNDGVENIKDVIF